MSREKDIKELRERSRTGAVVDNNNPCCNESYKKGE